MDSAHAEAAVVLINAGADRSRVRPRKVEFELTFIYLCRLTRTVRHPKKLQVSGALNKSAPDNMWWTYVESPDFTNG